MRSTKIKSIIKANLQYTIQNNAFCFMDGNRLPKSSAGEGLLGLLQDKLKKRGKFYYALLSIFSPVLTSRAFKKKLSQLLKIYQDNHIIINLGSGPRRLKDRKDIINVDIFAFDQVDVVSNADELPFIDESADSIINIAMLEHAQNPRQIILEMHRILKNSGSIFCYVPFMVPFHAAPNDYYRWTMSGTRELFVGFKKVDVFVGAGPTSGILWTIQEWLAIVLSLGNSSVHDILFVIIMVLTCPLKLIDLFMERLPNAKNIASGFVVVAVK